MQNVESHIGKNIRRLVDNLPLRYVIKNAAIRAEVNAISEKFSEIKISDEELFADPPPKEDCDICMHPIPYSIGMCQVYSLYKPCCGKTLCEGCNVAENEEIDKGNMKPWCAYCRTPFPYTKEELMERVQKRIAMGDAEAIDWLAEMYYKGEGFLPQDYIELLKQAADSGVIRAHNTLAYAYKDGEGVEMSMSKAIHHWKIAAMGGHEYARFMLGDIEKYKDNMDRAIKHYLIAARCGYDTSLKAVGEGYKAGYVSKEEYACTLRAYQHIRNDMQSEQRTNADAGANKHCSLARASV